MNINVLKSATPSAKPSHLTQAVPDDDCGSADCSAFPASGHEPPMAGAAPSSIDDDTLVRVTAHMGDDRTPWSLPVRVADFERFLDIPADTASTIRDEMQRTGRSYVGGRDVEYELEVV